MNIFFNGYFYNPTKGNLLLEEVIDEMFYYMSEKKDMFYDIVVGCDSCSNEEPSFPVAIVILRKKSGGRFFLKSIKYKNRKFYNFKERILEEVMLSCDLALSLKDKFQDRFKNLNYQFRYIHADVGENGETKDMIKEVTGLIRGNGFEPKIKPESFAASSVADKYT
ncbi:MAG: ribonuclease H-like YkuK family protein [Patescibacteria group bacterium]|nr:ribonuclease H-like YkuK family protein [Patescibacteria group bacterium]